LRQPTQELYASNNRARSDIINKLFDTYNQEPGVRIAYIYHDIHDTNKFNTLGRIIITLIAQLCRQLGEIPTDLIALQSKHSSPSVLGTEETFRSLAGKFSKVFLVIDVLDEWPTVIKHEILDLLLKLKDEGPPIFKTLVTSRPENDIRAKLEGSDTIDLVARSKHVLREIETVVRGKVDDFVKNKTLHLEDATRKDDIVSQLTQNSQGNSVSHPHDRGWMLTVTVSSGLCLPSTPSAK
jgi:hypothetical protein